MILPQAWFAISLTQKVVPRELGWITGDVQERRWSCALLSLSPRRQLCCGWGTAPLTSPCLQDLL